MKINYNDRDGTANVLSGETVSELIDTVPDNIQKEYARKHLLTGANPISFVNLMQDTFGWQINEMNLGMEEVAEEDCCGQSCGCH